MIHESEPHTGTEGGHLGRPLHMPAEEPSAHVLPAFPSSVKRDFLHRQYKVFSAIPQGFFCLAGPQQGSERGGLAGFRRG